MPEAQSGRTPISCIDPSLVARAETVMKILGARKLSVVTAESCTAGLIAAVLSEADGASACLHGGFVTYTKTQKNAALGVSLKLLVARGSVHGDVAKEMAEGALARSPADIAIALTGVLGPTEDEDGNPVGLLIFALCRRGVEPRIVEKRLAPAGHDELRHSAIMTALDLIEEAASVAGG